MQDTVERLLDAGRAFDDEHDGALHFLRTAEEELASRDRYTWATFRLLRAQLMATRDGAQAADLAREALAVFEQIGSEPMRARAFSLIAETAGGA